MGQAATASESLAVSDVSELKQELDLGGSQPDAAAAGDELDKKAESMVDALTTFDGGDVEKQEGIKSAVENMGYELQRETPTAPPAPSGSSGRAAATSVPSGADSRSAPSAHGQTAPACCAPSTHSTGSSAMWSDALATPTVTCPSPPLPS